MNFLNAIKHASIGYGIQRKEWEGKVILLMDNLCDLRWVDSGDVAVLLGGDLTKDITEEDIKATDWETVKGYTMPPVPRRSSEEPKDDKVAYVKSQPQTRSHHCHWPGCNKQVPPDMWGCYFHWMKLPKYLRDRIWAAYRSGQEKDMHPSREYLTVAGEVQDWIKAHHGVE